MSELTSIFKQINNAVLDLQSSQLQTYEQPLKRLSKLLNSPELSAINSELLKSADLDEFLKRADQPRGSVGSGKLNWPDDATQVLGLQLRIIDWLADDPDRTWNFAHEYYYAGSKLIANVQALVGQLIVPFARDYKDFVLSKVQPQAAIFQPGQSRRIFVVHGHDGEARVTVARYLEKLGFDAIILSEQPTKGRTIIEKIEANSDVGFAVVLLTPDDEGCKKGQALQPRARENVLLELGYFMGRLGRSRVCALRKGDVVIPSDFAGVVWEEMDSRGWEQTLARELKAAGYEIDWNKVMV